ncbi:MAG: hypothetical protein ACE15E_23525 [Acidobacteriota bacterium]
MSLSYLLIPLFFIALILYVSWPLLTEVEPPPEPTPTRRRKKSR